MKDNKTHYRKVFKSNHLGVADLEDFLEEGKKLIFTIKVVNQEFGTKVAGRQINANIAYFKESIKPLVLNSTNSKVVKSFNNQSPFVEDWSNTTIELYIDSTVKMKGEVVGGVRIRPIQPKVAVKKAAFVEANFEKACAAKATIVFIKSIYSITPAMEKKYNDYVAAKN